MYVIKRNGKKVAFKKQKITKAIEKAFESVDGEITEYAIKKAENIANYIEAMDKDLDIETIQDYVEKGLMSTNRKDVAKAYIIYRAARTDERNKRLKRDKIIREKLFATNVKNQNANVDEYSFGGRMGEANSEVMRNIALDDIISEKHVYNHINNRIYIHDLDQYACGSHNCFLRDTRFITTEGIKSFKDFRDGDEVTVLTKNGTWNPAIVRYYGNQQMYEVTVTRCGITKVIAVTRNHRWLLHDGVFTDNLQIGDMLYPLPQMQTNEIGTTRQAQMFALGFVLGDGYDHDNVLEVKFCNKQKESYIEIFAKAGYHIGISNNFKYARKKHFFSKQDFLNNRMWRVLSFEDKQALFEGYLAADGSKTTNSKYIWTSDIRMCELIEEISALSGYHVFKKRKIINSTKYKKNRVLYEYVLTFSYKNNTTWKVVDIKRGRFRGTSSGAWCLEEPETHTFTLEGGIITGNCLSIPFDKLLKNGFKTRQTDVRPAGSINTAFQLVAVIFQLQSLNQFGGVSATHLDWTMIPYVRKSFYKHYCDYIKIIKEKEVPDIFNVLMEIEDEKYKQYDFKAYKYALIQTKKELKQAVEGLFHNLNTLQSRSGNQLPFTSINYGTCTKPEGQMVIEALLDGSINGVGKLHKTSSFPCCIFQVMKGVNKEPNTPNYYLYRKALYSTAKRLYPNYCNVDWSGNEGYDKNDPKTFFSTMGCRTANGWDINGFKQTKDGRGNICPVTIIMPTLAMEAKIKNGDVVKNFLEILDKAISDAKDCLIERFEWICSQSPKSASFMYENGVMEGYIPEEGIRSALKHGTLAMGNIGLAETLQILIGCDHTTDKGMKLAKQIYQLFKDRCAQYKEQYKLNFGVYMTPAENLSYTAMQKFKKKYGVIKNVSENEFFTNSMHVPVWKQMNPFEKIDIEGQLTGYSSAGCITYTELDSEAIQNIDAIETIVNYAMDKDIPYFAINVPNDTCDDCGYSAEIDTVCPQCGSSNIQRLRRVTGYITADYKTSFNPGKKQEVEMRVKHMKFKQRDKN